MTIEPFVNKIIEGDCQEVLPTLPDSSVDMVLTDPPYFLPVNSYVGTREKGYAGRTLADTSILKGYFKNVLSELARILRANGTFYIFCDAQSYPVFYEVMFPHCKHVRLLVWDKTVSYNGYTWRHQHELIAWGEREETERVPTGDGDVIRCRGVLQKDRHHPAEKPVELLSRLIRKHPSANLILDPYLGSGSTAIAARALNRKYVGIELNPDYVKIARQRLGVELEKFVEG